MLVFGGLALTILAGVVSYGWLFARRSPIERLAFSVAVAALTLVVLFAVMAVLVALTFAR